MAGQTPDPDRANCPNGNNCEYVNRREGLQSLRSKKSAKSLVIWPSPPLRTTVIARRVGIMVHGTTSRKSFVFREVCHGGPITDDLPRFCCQNSECPDHSLRGAGNLTVRDHYGPNNARRMLRCRICKSRSSGTPFEDIIPPPPGVRQALGYRMTL